MNPLPVIAAMALALAACARGADASADHWALQPIGSPGPPEVRDAAWPRSPIDRFILARLEENHAAPAPDADRATLCRRLHFDLTGLPPTPEQVTDFVADIRPDAVERLVDELLASPRFGEHWARRWFDIVRFAESVTLRGFIFKEAWRYRDYVIDALNRDLPMDQFLREQIAGDLLPADGVAERQRHLVATTFLMLGNTNLEEQDKRQLELDFIDEQLEVIGKAFLGQTIACARCHDHMFDPIPTRDYYAMAGILDNAVALRHANVSAWVEQPLPLAPEVESRIREHEEIIGGLRARIAAATGELNAGALAPIPAGQLPGIVIDSTAAVQIGEWQHSTHTRPYIEDGYLHDRNEGKGAKSLTFPVILPAPGPAEIRFAYTPGDNRADAVPVTIFHARGETALTLNQRERPNLPGGFVSFGVFYFETNGFSRVLVSNEGTRGHVIADAVQVLPVTENTAATAATAATAPVGSADHDARAAGTPDPATLIRELEQELRSLEASSPRRPMVMAPREATNIVDRPVLHRGSHHAPGELVPRGFLSNIPAPPDLEIPPDESGRRQLAEWIVSDVNPLTARVLANRIWLWCIGEGIVRTPDNFGSTGQPPTHPELLDWLATRLARGAEDRGAWSLKGLVREIVLSRTYSVASSASEGSSDPENRLLGRAFRKRLTAEQIRDAMLSVSGRLRLDPPAGPTYPPDRAADYGFATDLPVRSVYLPVFRNSLPDFLEAFDFPPPVMVTGRRAEATVPTQALFLLNHPFVFEQSRAAALRILDAAGSEDPDRLARLAYQIALSREPSHSELEAVLPVLDEMHGRSDGMTRLMHALLASAEFRHLH